MREIQYLHPPTELEELTARGEYVYLHNNQAVGQEAWALHECRDGTAVWRSEFEDERGHVLSHLLLSPDRRADRLQVRLRPQGRSEQQAVYTFYDDNVMLVQHGRRLILDLPPDYTLLAVDVGSRALALPPLDWEGAQPTVQMVFTVLLRGDTFWSKPVKWAAHPLGTDLSVTVGDTTYQARAVRLSVPDLPDQRGWFDRHGIPLRWQSGTGDDLWEAWLTRYVRLRDAEV